MKNLFNQLNLILFSLGLFYSLSTYAQCTGGVNGGATPTLTATYQTMAVVAGEYYTFTALTGCTTYDFSFCAGGGSAAFDTQLTILDDTGTYVGAPGYNDDASCGLQSEILGWTPPAAGTYRIFFSQYWCSNSGAGATLAIRENGPTLSTTGDYTLQSNATTDVDPLCVQLTANSAGQTGCAWDANSTLDFASDFTFDFTVNLGSNDGGADGLTFVLQNDPAGTCACGNNGGDFAAGGISNSLIVEIDTYLNTEDRDDGALMAAQGVACAGGTEPDHLDIWLNGVVNPGGACPNAGYPTQRAIPSAAPLMDGGSLYNVENGNDHILRVTWNAGTGVFSASLMNLALTTTYATVSIGAPDFDPVTVFGTTTPFFGFTAATGGLSNQQTFCNPATLLPVKVVDFNVDCNVSNTVLSWEIASENNNDYFTVLRSVDGVNFEEIGQVDGGGNNNSAMMYRFTDENRPNQQCYYTFSQTDFNGVETLCGFVRVVDCKTEAEFTIFPNPTRSNEPLFITLEENEDIIVTIFDARGQIVFMEQINIDNQKIIYPNLNSGMYSVVVSNLSGNETQTTKLVVMN